jgi:predicted alpha/beta hydrolase
MIMRNPAQNTPSARHLDLVASDGFSLGATLFPPSRPGLGTVIVHGATAVPQTYYRRFAEFLASRGLRVLTYDFRGVGQSRPAELAGFAATMTDWARRDAAAAHAWVRDHHGDEPLALVGHSFGGQLLGLLDEAEDALGALLVGSQLGSLSLWPPLRRALFSTYLRAIVPAAATAFGYLPGWTGLGADLPAGVAREWAGWCLQPRYLLDSHPDAAARFAAFRRPVLLYSFSDDGYAPRRTVEALARVLAGADLEERRLGPADVGAPIGHFGYFRPTFAARLWPEAASWLRAVLAGEPPPRDVLITEEELARDLGYR